MNITDDGFPDNITALRWWEKAFNTHWQFRFAFATTIAISPDGTLPLGSSGSGYQSQWKTAPNYHPELYLKFLEGSLDRNNRLSTITKNPILTFEQKKAKLIPLYAETLAQMGSASH